jgi:signal transduction histidine kinase
MDKIFEPFFTSKATGSGLGLTLAMQIISSHGGSMDVVRHDPCGTSVIIHLPVQAPACQRTVAPIPNNGGEKH